MKRVFIQMIAAIVCVSFVSCGGGSGSSGGSSSSKSGTLSPSEVVGKAFGAKLKGDAKTYFSYCYQEGLNEEQKKKRIEGLKAAMKYETMVKYEVLREEMLNDVKAYVFLKVDYKDGNSDDRYQLVVVKTDDGWKIDL